MVEWLDNQVSCLLPQSIISDGRMVEQLPQSIISHGRIVGQPSLVSAGRVFNIGEELKGEFGCNWLWWFLQSVVWDKVVEVFGQLNEWVVEIRISIEMQCGKVYVDTLCLNWWKR